MNAERLDVYLKASSGSQVLMPVSFNLSNMSD